MRRLISSLTVCLLLSGCAMQQPYARINDVSMPEGVDSGYLLVSIDGAPVQRATSEASTTAPNAMVRAGKHTFELKNKRDPQAPHMKIEAEVQGEREYRFAVKGDKVVLVPTYIGMQAETQAPGEGDWLLQAILGM